MKGSRVRVPFPAPDSSGPSHRNRLQLDDKDPVFGVLSFPGHARIVRHVARDVRAKRLPAGWQSGYAADCKSAYAGSIPTSASRRKPRSDAGLFSCAPPRERNAPALFSSDPVPAIVAIPHSLIVRMSSMHAMHLERARASTASRAGNTRARERWRLSVARCSTSSYSTSRPPGFRFR